MTSDKSRADALTDAIETYSIEGIVRFMRSDAEKQVCVCCPPGGGHIFSRRVEWDNWETNRASHFGNCPDVLVSSKVTDRNSNEGKRVRLTVEVLDDSTSSSVEQHEPAPTDAICVADRVALRTAIDLAECMGIFDGEKTAHLRAILASQPEPPAADEPEWCERCGYPCVCLPKQPAADERAAFEAYELRVHGTRIEMTASGEQYAHPPTEDRWIGWLAHATSPNAAGAEERADARYDSANWAGGRQCRSAASIASSTISGDQGKRSASAGRSGEPSMSRMKTEAQINRRWVEILIETLSLEKPTTIGPNDASCFVNALRRILTAQQPEPRASVGVITAAIAVIEADRAHALTDDHIDALDVAVKIQHGMFKVPEPRDAITRSKRVLALVDEYHEHPTRDTRAALRHVLMDEFQPEPRVDVTDDDIITACDAHGITLPAEALEAATALVNHFAASSGAPYDHR